MVPVTRHDVSTRLANGHNGGEPALLVVHDFGAVERMANLLRSTGALVSLEPDATFIARHVQAAAVDLSHLLVARVKQANGAQPPRRATGTEGSAR